MKKRKSKSMIRSALILSGAGAICKILGMVYRILLSNILGTQGVGNYQLAYSIYSMLLVAASGGMPAALSAVVAKRFAKADAQGALEYLQASRRIMGLLGVSFGLLLYTFSGLLARWMGMESVESVLRASTPAVFFVAVTSAYRGFFQGAQDMLPSAFSQICEQIVKITAGVSLATRLVHKGDAYGAMGAMLGVTLSEGAGLIAIRISGKGRLLPRHKQKHWGRKAAELMKKALPITLGTAIIPILGSIDSLMSMKMLQRAGYSYDTASALYGLYSGFVLPVVHLPGILASAISVSLVPAIASAIANDRKDLQRRQFSFGLKIMCVLGIPLSFGLWGLAQPILSVLYRNLKMEEMMQAAELLRLMAPCALFAMAAQVTGGMLQGMDHMTIPVINLAIGAVCKIVLGSLLIGIPGIHIKGAAIGSTACYLTAAVLNTLAVLKYGNGEYRFADCWLKPLVLSVVMLIAVCKSYEVLQGISSALALVCAIVCGTLIYTVGIFASGALSRRDFSKQATEMPFYKRSRLPLL